MVNIIGERIKILRLSKGKTQDDLGGLMHVKKQTISKWENGINIPDAETLRILSDVLDCTSDYLLGKTDNPDSKIYTYEDIEVEVSKEYPYELTPEQVETLVKTLKEYRFDIDSLIKDIKDGKKNNEF